MQRILHKSNDKKDADDWDIQQQISMTPDERLSISKELKKRVYGKHVPDVRKAHKRALK
jgi:hypothetical protein